ncbi:MAG: hypothetical protein HY657_10165 [Acidobacteria bacterium]|nr:hypothetical protein [Acidobacteriota bacterium]
MKGIHASRVEAILEWIVAALVTAVVLVVGSLIVREFQAVSAVPVVAREAPADVPQTPAGVPPRAVFVPLLLLPDGKELRVGESFLDVAERLGRQAEVGTQSVERAPNGERWTRFYEHAGVRFVLVFEPRERDAEPRVAAIYLLN